jgi:beta-lactamase superfamily II metal-dependent hydrolase
MRTRYVKTETTQLFRSEDDDKTVLELLWGDGVIVDDAAGDAGRIPAKARGREGFVEAADLGDEALLELYFIDVGQGDGVLVCTPDRRHVLIDGGYKRRAQPTGKNAADFVDWKFAKEYGADRIRLDAMIASHNDADHYGGLWDLLNADEKDELDLDEVEVGAFYHAGVGWWQDAEGKRSLGPIESGFLTRLMESQDSAADGLDGLPDGSRLQGEWAKFIRCIVDCGCPVQRLSHMSDYLPGFGPDDGDVAVRVLGPVQEEHAGAPALRSLGSPSQNTNGHSVLLRVDYGRTRILLTGDLNASSQQILLEHYTGKRQELAADVVKGCHHGSDDCSYEFLSTVGASATVISSGDNEGHAHPRPSIVAASALTGHTRIHNDRVVTPLIYSTEIARSVKLGKVLEVADESKGISLTPDSKARIEYAETGAGDLRAGRGHRNLGGSYVVSGIIYGLVNVRTDGNRILCATLNEKSHTWDVKSFDSRF